MDINRKLLKTYAGLINYLKITRPEKLRIILYYFNPSKRWVNNYIPSAHVYRGSQLFEKYFSKTDFQSVDDCLRTIGNNAEVLHMFDILYDRIRGKRVLE